MECPPQKSLQPNKSTIMVSWYEGNKEEPCKQQAARADDGGHSFLEAREKFSEAQKTA